ncbi:MAG: hypothetical protein DI537_32945 [Stutzerimonas stutzeri]|nr:MAG: hypothetical protein DI537_32945 [Stutzerimonas stutzeri]
MTQTRSTRVDVRNPVLGLPNVDRIKDIDPTARQLLADILGEIAKDARERAQESWRKNKAPMAAYWKGVSTYAGHIKRAVRP